MRLAAVCTIVACASVRPFPLREPFTVDTDTRPVSVPCHPDPTPKEPHRVTCAPRAYISPFAWNTVDNSFFAPVSRALAVDVIGEAANANSLDEVADSSWFTNRPMLPSEQLTMGACKPDDLLPASEEVPDGAWIIDHGKDDGSTLGFRVDIPGKGHYLLKADDLGKPERASAASVIGAAIYYAAGFFTSCEQVVVIRKSQLVLRPGLKTIDNAGLSHPFDDKALDKVLASTTQVAGKRVRLQASKWLPGVTLGPFRYEHMREDDPNDVIPHENRRELRGSRILAAWIDHWDAREQNSMDVWLASDPKHERSSPGYVRHNILDTSDTLGGEVDPATMAARLGHSYIMDFADIMIDFVTLGVIERPWDRSERVKGHEKFAFFALHDFDPENWKPLYPNPAFLRMTERDGAWMARILARFSPDDIHDLVVAGKFSQPSDVEYLTRILIDRQHRVLARYFSRLSPLGDVRQGGDQICVTDFARIRAVFGAETFRYRIVEHGGHQRLELESSRTADGVCFRPVPLVEGNFTDADPHRRVTIEIHNGGPAGPLEIHAYDLGVRGMRVVGATRPSS